MKYDPHKPLKYYRDYKINSKKLTLEMKYFMPLFILGCYFAAYYLVMFFGFLIF